MNKAISILPLLFLNCGYPSYQKITGQVKAEALIWQQMYREDPDNMPNIIWKYQAELDCYGTEAGTSINFWGFKDGPSLCVFGLYDPDINTATISFPDGAKNFRNRFCT